MTRIIEVRPGHYHDSVSLMQLSQALMEDEAVDHAQVAMGTALNLDLLTDLGYDRPDAASADLVIAVDADGSAIERLRKVVDTLLAASASRRGLTVSDLAPAKTVGTAVDAGATVVLISVPGEHAFRQAVEAIEAGAHPIIFSDNVSLDHEVIIKELANEAGLLAMGPDCGTVVLDGVGLGFANVVSPGAIGLVSASGTGAQQVCAITDYAGVGVRHVLGLGGRDLSDEVGGLTALPAIGLLDSDPGVEVIGVIAKTIGPETARALDALTAETQTPTVMIPIDDLTLGTSALLGTIGVAMPDLPTWMPPQKRRRGPGRVLGLYSGGTLAAEAERILSAESGVDAEVIDLGDDIYTRGRPHPMIDARLRVERLREAGRSDDVGAVLLDVVLGHGAAQNPAADLGPAVSDLPMPVHIALIGTADDPQGRDSQAEALAAAGASVYLSNAAAARAAGQT